jgi:hypothetical protein
MLVVHTRRAVVLALALVTGFAGIAAAQASSPTIQGPITSPGGAFIASTTFDLASVGYEQAEYFISGTASAYTNTAPLGDDGIWSVMPSGTTAAYKTRILVNRPTNPKKFNGTVVVEWLNVSGGLDASPDWTSGHVELIREGAAWVGVSAQFVGVEGGPGLVSVVSLPLKQVNSARYGSLVHPGDSFSYDIYSQAGQAIRTPSGPSPLGDLKLKRVIAAGESQSAFRMVTYINAIHPLVHVYDGFLVHSRGALGAGLSETPQPSIPVPGGVKIRSDVDVPVLTFETETDLTFLGYFGVRQDDAKNFRLWEVAGTAHADTYTLSVGNTDLGNSPDAANVVITTAPVPGFIQCDSPVNSGPQHYVLNAAFAKLIRWVRTGKAPKSAPRLDVSAGPPVTINVDANGNALGGIRTPQVDVPIAAFTGEQEGTILCRLFGTTTLFDDATLSSLYPTHKTFTKAYNKSLNRAVKAGWIVKADAKLIKKWAAESTIGG